MKNSSTLILPEQCTTYAIVLACAMLLFACGGGGGGGNAAGSSANTTAAPSAAASSTTTVTVAAFAAATQDASAPAAYPSARLNSFNAAVTSLAVQQLHARIDEYVATSFDTPVPEAVSTPPLSLAVLQLISAAASGNTLSDIQSANADLGNQADWADLAWLLSGAQGRTRALTGKTDAAFARDFLMATRQVPAWSAAESAFPVQAGDVTETRLSVTDALHLSLAWPAYASFEGIMQPLALAVGIDGAPRYKLPMMRFTSGVQRFTGSDYLADRMPLGNGLSLVMLKPAASLQAYASSRLSLALPEALAGLYGSAVSAGEIVLPAQAHYSPRVSPQGGVRGAGSAFFDSLADLHALDLQGGDFVQVDSPSAQLSLGANALGFDQSVTTLFLHRLDNPGNGAINIRLEGGSVNTCYTDTRAPDLYPFFLAIVADAQRGIVFLAAIQTPGRDATYIGNTLCSTS